MLRRLSVENYALIEHLELELDEHLNILTGETGAGKSILLGALGLLLGNKNDGSAMKDASKNCVIEGQFSIAGLGLESLFDQNDLDYEEELTLRRVITPAGKSRSFVGDMPVQLSVVKELGAHLLDIHSQHQNLILQSEKFRTEALDTLAQNAELRTAYADAYQRVGELSRHLEELRTELERVRRDEEWLRHQAEELNSAHLKAGEVAELEQEQALLAHADRIGEVLGGLHQTLDDEELGILPRIKGLESALNQIREIYPEAADWAGRLRSTLLELKDIDASAAEAYDGLEADPERLQRVDDRLALLYSLCQKHRVQNLDELIEVHKGYLQQLATIDHSDEALRAAEKELQEALHKARELADKLHKSRAKAAPEFEQAILSTLSRLGLAETTFCVELQPIELSPSGADSVQFLFSANRMMSPQPIERIASGGELSRVMLALKALLARRMQLPTILFDEIDTGVSGRIAEAMGAIISELAASMQVVDITHLPQVASKGESHFVVYKQEGRTRLRRLAEEERVEEIAKMLSGAEITPAALEQARILLKK